MNNAWNWDKFRGSKAGLKWNRRDVPDVDEVASYAPEHRVAVQAGGNLGIFPKRLSELFEVVYTFEPEPELFGMMAANAPELNIVKFQAALGCNRGELVGMCRVRRQNDGGLSHEGITHVSGAGIIPTMRLDDLALPVCDLLYLDLEGYEFYALRGAEETIARCRPVLACEINKSLDGMKIIDKHMLRAYIEMGLGYEFVKRVRSDDLFVPVERAPPQEAT